MDIFQKESRRFYLEKSQQVEDTCQKEIFKKLANEVREEASVRWAAGSRAIGYSTCHWCHVMEYVSFENERIARNNLVIDRHTC